ncbi:olfactomedin-like 2Ba [Periophthalmus magnuspinnatus]|uniref:olfactomedin-like 2Ba n=1 Tax=Periophthalmus magnuspinnatus TaxID=409849 RepID=UPI002436381E|nr:olfactomedin-like 2Ba [Periophthalmus magnuspinnatus]
MRCCVILLESIAVRMYLCIVLLTCGALLEQSSAAPQRKRSADTEHVQQIEPLQQEVHGHESILSQLLGDYDKVKAISEGSDCRCKCVVRPLSRTACRRIEEGHARVEDFYTVETITNGPECKCACIAPPSAVNPCEGEYRLKKLREAGKENAKLSTILDLLEGSLYGMDLLKLHSVTNHLLERIDHMEKVVWNKSHAEANPQQSPPLQADNSESPPTQSANEKKNKNLLHTQVNSAKFKEKFVRESPSVLHAERSAEVIEMSSKETPRSTVHQVTKTGPNGLIIRGMTFYKSESDPMVADDGEPGENLFEYDGFSGDGPINLFIEENLLQHKTPRPRARLGQRTFKSKTSEYRKPKEGDTQKESPNIPSETTTHFPSSTNSKLYLQKYTSKPKLLLVDLTDEPLVTKTTVEPIPSPGKKASKDSKSFLTSRIPPIMMKTSDQTLNVQPTMASSTSTSTTTATTMVPTSYTTTLKLTTSALSTESSKDETPMPLSTQPLTPLTPGHSPQASTTPGTIMSSATTITATLFSSTAAETVPVESKPIKVEKLHTRKPADCKDTLATISEPVTHNMYGRREGAWMKDSKSDSGKIYVTNYFYGNNLLEFASLEVFKQGHFTNSYKLPYNWIGTGHVVYRGAFYYNRAFSRDIIKFDLHHRYVAAWTMLHDVVFEESSSPWEWRSYTDINIAVDESGLWIIYPALDDEGFLQEVVVVSRLNPVDLSMQRETTWRTGLRRNQYGNCFIVCGVLYFVDSYNQREANLEYAFDTHTNTQMIPRMPFTNIYTFTTQLDYNPKEGVLYAWDNGHQVTYNIKFAYVDP